MAGAIRPHGGPVEAGVHPSDAEERSMVHARLQRGQDPPDAVVMRIRQTQLQSGPISNHPFFIPNISQSIYTTSTSTCQLFKHATSEPLKCTAVVMVNACYHDYTKTISMFHQDPERCKIWNAKWNHYWLFAKILIYLLTRKCLSKLSSNFSNLSKKISHTSTTILKDIRSNSKIRFYEFQAHKLILFLSFPIFNDSFLFDQIFFVCIIKLSFVCIIVCIILTVLFHFEPTVYF